MGSGIYSEVLGLSQVPDQVLSNCFEIIFLQPRHQHHSSYSEDRKPIQILSTFLTYLPSIIVPKIDHYPCLFNCIDDNDTTCNTFLHSI